MLSLLLSLRLPLLPIILFLTIIITVTVTLYTHLPFVISINYFILVLPSLAENKHPAEYQPSTNTHTHILEIPVIHYWNLKYIVVKKK